MRETNHWVGNFAIYTMYLKKKKKFSLLLASAVLSWPHCRWNIKWPAWLLILTFMDRMLLWIINLFTCSFLFLCPPVMYCTKCEPTATQWGFNPCEEALGTAPDWKLEQAGMLWMKYCFRVPRCSKITWLYLKGTQKVSSLKNRGF